MVWHKQGVQIVRMAVQGGVQTGKVHLHLIHALLHQFLRYNDMLIADLGLPRHPVNCAIARKTPLEVKNDVDTVFEEEVNDDCTADILAYVGRDSECQVIIDETDVCCTLFGESFGNPLFNCR